MYDNSLWFSSDIGVHRIDSARKSIIFYPIKELNSEILNNDVIWNINEGYKHDNKIYMGGGGNPPIYYVFDPEKLTKPIAIVKPYITTLWLNGEPVKPGKNSVINTSIEKMEVLKLRNDQNIFSLEIANIDFQELKNKTIYYMLEGFDLEWKTSKPNDRLSFFKIPTGN